MFVRVSLYSAARRFDLNAAAKSFTTIYASTTPPEGHAPPWSLAHVAATQDDDRARHLAAVVGDRCAEDQWTVCARVYCVRARALPAAAVAVDQCGGEGGDGRTGSSGEDDDDDHQQ